MKPWKKRRKPTRNSRPCQRKSMLRRRVNRADLRIKKTNNEWQLRARPSLAVKAENRRSGQPESLVRTVEETEPEQISMKLRKEEAPAFASASSNLTRMNFTRPVSD